MTASYAAPKPVENLNSDQLETLASFVAPPGVSTGYPDGGTLTETVKESKELDRGTQLLYLERAVTQDCKSFNESLDKLYRPTLEGEAKDANIELVRSLKTINDLCFNNEVKFGVYGMKRAVDHFFGKMQYAGEFKPEAFQVKTREMVTESIRVTTEKDENKEIPTQRAARIALEASIAPQTGWRELLDLPLAQQLAPLVVPVAAAPPQAGALIGAGMFAPPPLPPAVPTVDDIQALLVGGSISQMYALSELAQSNVATATLIFNTPHLRAIMLDPIPDMIRIHLINIATQSLGHAALILNDLELRERLLTDDPELARGVLGGIGGIVEHGAEQAIFILNNPDLRGHLLSNTPENNIGMLGYIAGRYPESEAVQALCAQHMPVLPHHHQP